MQPLPSAKRNATDRKESERWLSYYAGYSTSFVRAAFEAIGITERDLVLDPWSGSGTTGMVALQSEIQCVNIEINPVVAYLASGHFSTLTLSSDQISKVINVLENFMKFVSTSKNKNIRGTEVLQYVQRRLSPTSHFFARKSSRVETVCPEFSMAISVILLAFRKNAGYRASKNPTWLSHPESVVDADALCIAMQHEIGRISLLGAKERKKTRSHQIIGDSRSLPLPPDSIDAIVTSPPYLTRIDYAKTTAAETTWLFGSEQLRTQREQSMGAPVIRPLPTTLEWLKTSLLADVLSTVKGHPSYAARSYYLKTFLQYFDDMYRSLTEIHRVLKPRGIALLVVQNSYFKEVEIPLGEIYVDIWNRCFGAGEIAARHTASNSIVQVNSRAVSSRMTKHLNEDTVALYK